MNDYTPDRWVIIKITTETDHLYKVLACWYGGYTGSDSWRVNSGIMQAELIDQHWQFSGHSGSIYSCHQSAYGTSGYGSGVLQNFINRAQDRGATVEIMPESTDWNTLDYIK